MLRLPKPEEPQGLKPDLEARISARLNRLRKKSAMKIYRRLKPALDEENKQLIGTTEVVP